MVIDHTEMIIFAAILLSPNNTLNILWLYSHVNTVSHVPYHWKSCSQHISCISLYLLFPEYRMRKEKFSSSDLKKSFCRIWCIQFPALQCPKALQSGASNNPVHSCEDNIWGVQCFLSGLLCKATSSVRNLLSVHTHLSRFAFWSF